MASANPTLQRSPTGLALALGLALLVVTLIRLVMIQPEATLGVFGHDSAYIARLAENLLAGKGYVNDAVWLVFLQPEGLPMPFHNANPLYPTLIAGVSWLTGISVLAAGYAINVVAHSLLLVALVLLLRPWVESLLTRSLLALGAGCFPAVFLDSLVYLPDLLCLLFLVAGLACIARSETLWAILLAGVFFGLAWLTRSSVLVALPLFVVPLMGRHGWRDGLGRCVLLGLAAGIATSPWLCHTYQVWGNPLRSDSAYYLWQDYLARDHGYDAEYFWHSTEMPPSTVAILTREPGAFLSFYAKSLPLVAYNSLGGWTTGNRWVAIWLVALILAALGRTAWAYRQASERPAWALPALAVAVYAVAALLAFAPRARSMEIRYLAPLSLALSLLLLAGLRAALARWDSWVNRVLIVLGLAFWLGWVPWQDVRLWAKLQAEVPQRVAYFEQVRALQPAVASSRPVVVGSSPYFYALATGGPALAIPHSDDVYLLNYMKRYGAHFVALTPEEIDFWRPAWKLTPPVGLKPRDDLSTDQLRVFEREGS